MAGRARQGWPGAGRGGEWPGVARWCRQGLEGASREQAGASRGGLGLAGARNVEEGRGGVGRAREGPSGAGRGGAGRAGAGRALLGQVGEALGSSPAQLQLCKVCFNCSQSCADACGVAG